MIIKKQMKCKDTTGWQECSIDGCTTESSKCYN